MLFKLIRTKERVTFRSYTESSASALGLAEKDVEEWLAVNPELLFGPEKVHVIGQSIAGRSMADILALDADGCLVIVEIKRDWSNRATVGQLLEYAAEMTGKTYDDLKKLDEDYWRRRNGERPYVPLIERFRELTDNPTADQSDIPRRQQGHRIFIVAPGSDKGLQRIVEWLKEYGVPICFVPFTLHVGPDADDILLEIEPQPKLQVAGENVASSWQGDWFFNTNETYAPGAYRKMFDLGVIAIYGYESGPANLMGCSKDERVFAYVNRRGVLAVGRILDGQVVPGNTVFNGEREFHVRVEWETIVSEGQGVTIKDVSGAVGYNLPVRCVFSGIYRHDAANWIADELHTRAG